MPGGFGGNEGQVSNSSLSSALLGEAKYWTAYGTMATSNSMMLGWS